MTMTETVLLIVGLWGLTDLAASLLEWRDESKAWGWITLGWMMWAFVAIWLAFLISIDRKPTVATTIHVTQE